MREVLAFTWVNTTFKLELLWIPWVFCLKCMIISSWSPCLKHRWWVIPWQCFPLPLSIREPEAKPAGIGDEGNHIGAAERIHRDGNWVGRNCSQIWCADLRRGQTWRQGCCEGLAPLPDSQYDTHRCGEWPTKLFKHAKLKSLSIKQFYFWRGAACDSNAVMLIFNISGCFGRAWRPGWTSPAHGWPWTGLVCISWCRKSLSTCVAFSGWRTSPLKASSAELVGSAHWRQISKFQRQLWSSVVGSA